MKILLIIIMSLVCSLSFSQNYPENIITITVPQAPGSGPDVTARFIADRLSNEYKTVVHVINKPGPGALLGTEYASKRPADGYNIAVVFTGAMILNKLLYKQLPYDPDKDFEYVYKIGSSGIAIVTSSTNNIKNIRDLINYAKNKSNGLSYGTTNTRNLTHIAGDIIMNILSIESTHIPYKGSAQGIADTSNGTLDIFIDGYSTIDPWVQSKRIKVIAITNDSRNRYGVETLSETDNRLIFQGSFYVATPRGTPENIIFKLNADLNRVMGNDLIKMGFENSGGTLTNLKTQVNDEKLLWKKLFSYSRMVPE